MWPLLERVDQGRLVHQRAARGVDEDHAGLHARDARFASRKPRVSSLRARWSEMTSDRASSSSSSTIVTPASARGERFQAITSMPMPFAMRATSGADAAEPDHAERLAEQLHAFERLPGAGADVAVHAREIAAGRHHQRDGLLGDGGVAVALDGVDLDPESASSVGDVHVARRTGAEEHDVLERVHCGPGSVGM